MLHAGTKFQASFPYPVGRPRSFMIGRKWSNDDAGALQYTHLPGFVPSSLLMSLASSGAVLGATGRMERQATFHSTLAHVPARERIYWGSNNRAEQVFRCQSAPFYAVVSMNHLLRYKICICVLAGIVLVLLLTIVVLFATNVIRITTANARPTPKPARVQLLAEYENSLSKFGLPVYWNADLGVYMAKLIIGQASNPSHIWTAVDTGSARFVVNHSDYDGSTAGAKPLQDPREKANNKQCTATVTYVSQVSNLLLFTDTVVFPQIEIDLASLCGSKAIPVAEKVLALQDIAIGVSKPPPGQTHEHVNVFGLSAVKAHEKVRIQDKQAYFIPSSCQTSAKPAYESPVLQAAHLLLQERGLPLVWAVCFLGNETQDDAGPHAFISFGPVRLPCFRAAFTPMVPSLRRASSEMGRAPGRYYVVEVDRCVHGPRDRPMSELTPLKGFPKYLLIDTGTTQFLLPGTHGTENARTLNSLAPSECAYVILANGAVTIPFHGNDVMYGGADSMPVFGILEDAVARNFSLDLDTGIMGCTSMRSMYIEFDCDRQRIGFAALPKRRSAP